MVKGSFYLLFAATLLITGCKFASRQELAKPPAERPAGIEQKVRYLLPPGASFTQPGITEPGVKRPPAVQEVDLDGDGLLELVAAYKLSTGSDTGGERAKPGQAAGFLIAHKKGGRYYKIWEQELGYAIADLRCRDVSGDGLPEVVAGGTVGTSAGNDLRVLSVAKDERGEPVVRQIWQTGYHRMDIGDFDREGRTEVALWVKDTGSAFAVEVYRSALPYAIGFEPAVSAYASYFPQVVGYYEKEVKKAPDARFLWYYLADSQVKAGWPEKALSSLEQGQRVGQGYPPAESFSVVRGEALVALKRCQDALESFNKAVAAGREMVDTSRSPGQSPAGVTGGKALGVKDIARAYYGTGLALEALGRYEEARASYNRAAELLTEWPLPERGLRRLNAKPAVEKVVRYLTSLKPASWGQAAKEITVWARQQGLFLNVVRSAADRDAKAPELLWIDLSRGDPAAVYEAHLISWRRPDNGEVRNQVFYTADAVEHGMTNTFEVTAARISGVDKEKREMGVIYDTAASGSGSPIPTYYLFRLEQDVWRILWRSPVEGSVWRAFHGRINLPEHGLGALTVTGELWTTDGQGNVFAEANPGPHRRFQDRWERAGNTYKRVKAAIIPSAYNTLVEFTWNLSTGEESQAARLVTDKSLVQKAKDAGMVQSPPGQGWILDFTDETQLERGPFKILSGPATGATVSFKKVGSQWLISSISKAHGT